jgi:hypothetical protein
MIEAFNQKRSHAIGKNFQVRKVVYPRWLVRINFETATLSFHTGSTAWWFKLHQSPNSLLRHTSKGTQFL